MLPSLLFSYSWGMQGSQVPPTRSPEKSVQLISEVQSRQVKLLEAVQIPKTVDKSLEVSPLIAYKAHVRQTKAVQVGRLSHKSVDIPQMTQIHLQVINASWIQKLQHTSVGRHVKKFQISAAEVQRPKALPEFTLKKGNKLLCSHSSIEGEVHQ